MTRSTADDANQIKQITIRDSRQIGIHVYTIFKLNWSAKISRLILHAVYNPVVNVFFKTDMEADSSVTCEIVGDEANEESLVYSLYKNIN
jgi:hypothetical protein